MSSFPGAAAKCGCQQCDKAQCCDFSISISNIDLSEPECQSGFLHCIGSPQIEYIDSYVTDWEWCAKSSCLAAVATACAFLPEQVDASESRDNTGQTACGGGSTPDTLTVFGQFCCIDTPGGYKFRYSARFLVVCVSTCWLSCYQRFEWESEEITTGFECPGDVETWTRTVGDSGDMETANI